MHVCALIKAKMEFELTMQNHELKDSFDEEFIKWSKAVIAYCKKKCTKSIAIQKLIKDIDVNCKLFTRI